MKYADALLKFWSINKKENLGSSAAGLYAYLVYRWFENKCEGFTLSDSELKKDLSLSFNTIRVLRQKLKAHKLIQYESKIGVPGYYNLLKDSLITESTINSRKRTNERKIKTLNPSENSSVKKIRRSNSKIEKEVSTVSQRNDNTNTNKTPLIGIEIPTYDEFLLFAKTLKNYVADADSSIKKQYNIWVDNGWNNTYNNKPITDWKALLTNILQFLIDENLNEDITLPRITNPKIVNNE